MFTALVFDFDGTILDTESPDYASWQEVYEEHGHTLPHDLWMTRIGGAGEGFDPHGHLETLIGQLLDREAIRARRRSRNLELIQEQQIRPGVLEYLEDARRLGLRLAIASSSPLTWVEGHLTRLGLVGYFEHLCTADDVPRVKPDPALYRLAAQRLGVEPGTAIAIEDSHNGMLAATGAGMVCVVCPNEITRGQDFTGAHLLLESLADLPLPSLLDVLAQAPRAALDAAG
jgi:HAD superfamily hydrolase (TIGR01509 family)